MNIILFDTPKRSNLLPLTYTRPISDLRCGILTLAQKWEKLNNKKASFLTENYLTSLFPTTYSTQNYYVNGQVLANKNIYKAISNLKTNTVLTHKGEIIAFTSEKAIALNDLNETVNSFEKTEYTEELYILSELYHLFKYNDWAIKNDIDILGPKKNKIPFSNGTQIIGNNIYIEEGAKIYASTINTENGPVYIGKNATIMEGCLIRGPFALCDNATLKMGAKIYGATTIGPHCKVGGEVNNSILQGYSNKGHDGFLGNSFIGEWCNLGADTNNSNLKNNYSSISIWDYNTMDYKNTGLQFCGLFMGDHGKSSINTMFNTGTVVGVSSNVFGGNFPKKHVPSYSWGGRVEFTFAKAMDVAENVMKRRNITLTNNYKEMMKAVFDITQNHR